MPVEAVDDLTAEQCVVPAMPAWVSGPRGRTFPAKAAVPVPRTPPAAFTVEEVVERVYQATAHIGREGNRAKAVRGARTVLSWLLEHPGDSWQERWESSGADGGKAWIGELAGRDPRRPKTAHDEIVAGVLRMLQCRVIYPGYGFLAAFKASDLFPATRRTVTPEHFLRLEQAGELAGMHPGQKADGLRIIAKMVLHTGRGADQITAEDVYAYREWRVTRPTADSERGIHAAWDLLRAAGTIGDVDLRSQLREGQRTMEELVDAHNIQSPEIRAVLIRYLKERRPGLDYGSIRTMSYYLAGLFWADIQWHHPEQRTLHLSNEVAAAWRERLTFLKSRPGEQRKDGFQALSLVRAFYLDIQEWAREDPWWAPWAAPSPVRKQDTAGHAKYRRKVQAEIHQRVRERLPHLSVLTLTAENHRDEQAALLAAAESVEVDEMFVHGAVTYRRTLTRAARTRPDRYPVHRALLENVETGELIDAEAAEDDAFWAWAVIQTLQNTGVRIEELTEITHLALISYRVPKTGEIVPMLQIVPSKTNEERLLLVSPELAGVLALIISRLRQQNGGSIPQVARYDPIERVTGPPMPHLFQRRIGWQAHVVSSSTIGKLLNATVARAGLTDAAGQPLRYTAHDFRRIFTTEIVAAGLPVHIAAKILGHSNLATVQHYLAVFPEHIVTTYRAFLAKRRSIRPEVEYREPTSAEWQEFQDHFELRKVELGVCGRPYGTECVHEHACLRCPMLQVDPRQEHRLAEIIQNLNDRITEAKANGWLGDVKGLTGWRDAGAAKLAGLRRKTTKKQPGTTDLGIPTIRTRQTP